MLAHESTYCVGVPGGSAEVSLHGLRALLGQVEAELYQSDIYGQMLSSLKALPEDLTRQVQSLVRAMGREAIRLALRKLVHKKPAVMVSSAGQGFASATLPMSAPKISRPPAPPPPNAQLSDAGKASDRHLPPVAVAPPVSPPTHLLNGRITLYPPTAKATAKRLSGNPPRKPSKKELAVQAALRAREACLQEIGQTMRQVRQDKAWSPYLLHIKTQIPMHQLEALEMGCIDRLPEDIYVRGFIRQVGNALGLDGNQMAASLPAIDTATAVLPSWQQPKARARLRLNSMHVYLGYAALMAGGIAWVSHQSAPHQGGAAPMPVPAVPSPKATPNQPTSAKASQKAAAATVNRAVATPGTVSPPERSPL